MLSTNVQGVTYRLDKKQPFFDFLSPFLIFSTFFDPGADTTREFFFDFWGISGPKGHRQSEAQARLGQPEQDGLGDNNYFPEIRKTLVKWDIHSPLCVDISQPTTSIGPVLRRQPNFSQQCCRPNLNNANSSLSYAISCWVISRVHSVTNALVREIS